MRNDRLFDESWTRVWDSNRLNLLVKHPTCVYAYWEVSSLRRQIVCQHFQSDWSRLPFLLRVHDVTDILFDGYAALFTTKIEVHPQSDHWYIENLQPNRNYLADFGTTTIGGQFVAILRSPTIRTPRIDAGTDLPFLDDGQPQFEKPGWRPDRSQDVPTLPQADLATPGTPPYANEFTGYGSTCTEILHSEGR